MPGIRIARSGPAAGPAAAEPVEGLVLPIYVPMALRPAHLRDQVSGNLTALMVVPLP
jgi:hypothetical protein